MKLLYKIIKNERSSFIIYRVQLGNSWESNSYEKSYQK